MLTKTDLCRQFEKDLSDRLLEFKDDFCALRDEFNPLDNFLKVSYTIFTPEEELFTKDGRISSRSVDTDAHKVMKDVIFKAIGIDDKLDRDSTFFTPVSRDGKWNYVIEFTICKKEALYV